MPVATIYLNIDTTACEKVNPVPTKLDLLLKQYAMVFEPVRNCLLSTTCSTIADIASLRTKVISILIETAQKTLDLLSTVGAFHNYKLRCFSGWVSFLIQVKAIIVAKVVSSVYSARKFFKFSTTLGAFYSYLGFSCRFDHRSCSKPVSAFARACYFSPAFCSCFKLLSAYFTFPNNMKLLNSFLCLMSTLTLPRAILGSRRQPTTVHTGIVFFSTMLTDFLYLHCPRFYKRTSRWSHKSFCCLGSPTTNGMAVAIC